MRRELVIMIPPQKNELVHLARKLKRYNAAATGEETKAPQEDVRALGVHTLTTRLGLGPHMKKSQGKTSQHLCRD